MNQGIIVFTLSVRSGVQIDIMKARAQHQFPLCAFYRIISIKSMYIKYAFTDVYSLYNKYKILNSCLGSTSYKQGNPLYGRKDRAIIIFSKA